LNGEVHQLTSLVEEYVEHSILILIFKLKYGSEELAKMAQCEMICVVSKALYETGDQVVLLLYATR
jgi:hypothetical protein